jgi:hypothetical protein
MVIFKERWRQKENRLREKSLMGHMRLARMHPVLHLFEFSLI